MEAHGGGSTLNTIHGGFDRSQSRTREKERERVRERERERITRHDERRRGRKKLL